MAAGVDAEQVSRQKKKAEGAKAAAKVVKAKATAEAAEARLRRDHTTATVKKTPHCAYYAYPAS